MRGVAWLVVVAVAVGFCPPVLGGPATLVRDINTQPDLEDHSDPYGFTEFGGATYFAADDGVHGNELWRSNGTSNGTRLVADINPGPQGSDLGNFATFRGALYFAASDEQNGCGLWRSDGTASGTRLVYVFLQRKPCFGFSPNGPASLTVVGGKLFFSADDGEHGRELWRSDGTAAGTVLVKNINTRRHEFGLEAESAPNHLTNVNGLLVFLADEGLVEPAPRLWRSDGTEAGGG